MAVIKSGASTDQLSIDATSKAARVTLYNPDGSLQVPAVKSSYVAFTAPFAPGATPQDVFTITGISGTGLGYARAYWCVREFYGGIRQADDPSLDL